MHHGEMKTALERPATQAGRIVRNSMLNFGGYVLNAGCNLLALCILARRMPVETFGAYYALYAMVMLLQLVLEAGGTENTDRHGGAIDIGIAAGEQKAVAEIE